MKICNVCGVTVEDKAAECPNCGSYSFRKQEKQKDMNRYTRFRY